ncbi:MAG: trimethylamine methyltransferase family protein, partial [Chloroflexota bacterium]
MTRRSARRRRARRKAQPQTPLADKPFRQLVNPMAPVEMLSSEQVDQIDRASMRILEEIGIDFLED